MAWQDFNKFADVGDPSAAFRQTPKPQGKKKGFLLDQISTAGGILGGIGGSFVAPIVGTAGGAAAGSALGEALENAITGDSIGKNVGKEALLGGVFGASPLKLARAGFGAVRGGARALPQRVLSSGTKGEVVSGGVLPRGIQKTSLQGKLVDTSNKLLTSQYGTISKPVARATRPEETFGKLANYGITKPDDVERIAGKFTGSNGIVSEAVLKAVGKSGRVSTDGVQQIFDDAIELNGLVDKDAAAVRSVFRAQMKKLMGGPSGSLRPDADPNDVLDVMKALEKRAANLTGKGGNYRLSTPERVDQAKALMTVRDELQDRLFQVASSKGSLSTVLTPQFRESLVSLQPGNAEWQKFVDGTVMKSKDIGSLRSSMAPFVRARQIIDEADINSATFGGRTGNLANGLMGGTLSSVLGPVAGIATGAVQAAARNPVARAVSGGLRKVGQSEGAIMAGTPRPSPLGVGTRLGLVGALSGAANQVGQTSAQEIPQGLSEALMPPTSNPTLIEQPSSDPMAPENLQSSVRKILANGGSIDDAAKFVGLAETLQKLNPATAGKTSFSDSAIKSITDVQSGIEQLQGLREQVGSSAGGPLSGRLRALNPYDTEFQSQQANINRVRQIVGKALEGGVLRKEDEEKYKKILPVMTDTPEVAQSKIDAIMQQLQSNLQQYVQFQTQTGKGAGQLPTDLAGALAASGY